MQAAPDPAVLQCAQVDEWVLVSADTDFGRLLSRSQATGPSVLLIRRLAGRRTAEQSAIILEPYPGTCAPLVSVSLHADPGARLSRYRGPLPP
jgi:predicted nuclease of predicted toxin-antitoxin system